MKLTVLLMCKNSGPIIETTIKSWIDSVDCICILDTGSTDNTIEIIKSIKSSKIRLYEHEFEGFSNSRNRLIKLAEQKHKADYFIMIDDSYILVENYKGSLRQELENLNNHGFKLISYLNKRGTMEYQVKRIFKKGHRYHGLIHEDIPLENDAVTGQFYINDVEVKEHNSRTKERMLNDVKVLKENINPLNMYYLGVTYNCLGNYKEAAKWFEKRLNEDVRQEERFYSGICLTVMYEKLGQINKAIEVCNRILKDPKILYKDRIGEVYYFLYVTTKDKKYIKLAYENKLGPSYMPCNKELYERIIPELYEEAFKK